MAGLACFVTFLLLAFILTREPTYAGRSASEWAEILIIPNSADAKTAKQAEKAFKEMGPEGIALLLDRLEHGESERMLTLRHRLKAFLGYRGTFYNAKERRLRYIEALGTLGTNAAVATPVLLRYLDSPDRDVVLRSATALQHTLGHENQVLPRMLTLLKGKDSELVQASIQTLRRYPGSKDQFLPILKNMIPGPDPAVIGFACHTIKVLAPADFETVAVPLLTNNFHSSDFVLITASLQALDSYQPPNRPLIDTLFPLLPHTNQLVRAKSIRLLAEWVNHSSCGHHRREEALAVCQTLLDDPEEDVRLAAAHALMSWGTDARKAIPKLARLYYQSTNTYGAKAEYRNVVFRLDPELAFELQNPPRNP